MAQTAANPARAAACPDLRSPTSLTELLRNIRAALACGLLFSRDLYNEERLIRLFGGTSVEWDSGAHSDVRSGEVRGLEQLIKPQVINGTTIRSLAINFRWQGLGDDWNSRLNVFFRGHAPLGFEDIIQLFGNSWTEDSTPPRPHEHYDTVTAPHGNQVILYDLNSNEGQARVRVEFRGDASLQSIVILSHGRK